MPTKKISKKLLDLEFLTHKEHTKYRNSHSEVFYRNGHLTKNPLLKCNYSGNIVKILEKYI